MLAFHSNEDGRLTWALPLAATPQSGTNPLQPPATLGVWLKCCPCCDPWPPCEHKWMMGQSSRGIKRQDGTTGWLGVLHAGSVPTTCNAMDKAPSRSVPTAHQKHGSEDDAQLTAAQLNKAC